MDPTNPSQEQTLDVTTDTTQTQETLDKSNVQKRIDEITAEKYAAQKRADEYANQVSQLTSTVAEMLRKQNEQAVQQPALPQIPEGVDPTLAKFFDDRLTKLDQEYKKRMDSLYWQMQNQMDQGAVAQKYAHLPPEVLKDAANRLTGLKQQYGPNANMDDAVAVAHFAWTQKQMQMGRQQQFNQMGQPLQQHGAPAQQQQSTNLVSPASLPNWDNLPQEVQWKLMDEYEKKGGKIGLM